MNPKRAHPKGTAMLSRSGRVAELADAQDSGSCVRKDVGVQVPPRPPQHCDVSRHRRQLSRDIVDTLSQSRPRGW
jgi:hypothetical protein